MIELKLSIEEVNMLLRVLSKHPFEEVFQVIGKIKQQGESQVEKPAEEKVSAEG